MKMKWRELSARFDALALRERGLILLAVVAGTVLVFEMLVFQPLEARKQRLTGELAEARLAIRSGDALRRTREAAVDAEAVKRTYLGELRKQLAEIDRNMQGLQKGLVPAEQMAKLLGDVLARSRGLQLVELRTLPPHRFEALAAAPETAGKDEGKTPSPESGRAIYRHSVEVTLQGSYADLHDYLAQLEKLPWQVYWGRIHMKVSHHPRLRVTLTVQTLSLSKAWLIV